MSKPIKYTRSKVVKITETQFQTLKKLEKDEVIILGRNKITLN